MKKLKKTVCILLIISLVSGTTPCYAADPSETNMIVNQPECFKISNDEYRKYAKYDIKISYESSEIKDELKYNKIKKILKDQVKLSSNFLGDMYYETYQCENINKLVPDFDSLNEVAYFQVGDTCWYSIDYDTINNERIILEYYSNGLETKSLLNKLTGKIIVVNNQNEKKVYDKITTNLIELTEDKKQQINDLITQDNIEGLKSIEGIDVQEIDGSIIVNLEKDITTTKGGEYSPLSTPLYKTNATPIYSSFPILNKTLITSSTVWSDALYYYHKSDCYVYAKVYKKRIDYVEQRFNYINFFANTALTVMGLALGCGTSVVSIIVYEAGAAMGIFKIMI